MKTLFTSESVTCGHPDKLCDQVADRILDAILAQDSFAHVACEVTATTNKLHIMGEITAKTSVDYATIARRTIADIGYIEPGHGFDAESCEITVDIHEQSPDIARGINSADLLESGAGDQGMMFGFACKETDNFMPLPIELAHRLTKRLQEVREFREIPYLLPDGKSQVTVEYIDGVPVHVTTVVVSSQHQTDADMDLLRREITNKVIKKALPSEMLDENTNIFINPTGRFAVGGPAGDTGLTGRKIIVDTYGGYSRHGGGAFSGKDPTKMDKSGAYMARYIAKNIIAAGLADKCEVQLSYAIGLPNPTSFMIEDFGTGVIPIERLRDFIENTVDMRPMAIVQNFGLNRSIYSKLSCYGHFGENAKDMPWERTDLADKLYKLK